MITRTDLALFIAFMVHFMMLVAGFTVLVTSAEGLGLTGVPSYASIPLFLISIFSLWDENSDRRSAFRRVEVSFCWWNFTFVLKNRM